LDAVLSTATLSWLIRLVPSVGLCHGTREQETIAATGLGINLLRRTITPHARRGGAAPDRYFDE